MHRVQRSGPEGYATGEHLVQGAGFYSTDYRGGTKAETTTKNGESGEKGTEKKSPSFEKVSGKQDR